MKHKSLRALEESVAAKINKAKHDLFDVLTAEYCVYPPDGDLYARRWQRLSVEAILKEDVKGSA